MPHGVSTSGKLIKQTSHYIPTLQQNHYIRLSYVLPISFITRFMLGAFLTCLHVLRLALHSNILLYTFVINKRSCTPYGNSTGINSLFCTSTLNLTRHKKNLYRFFAVRIEDYILIAPRFLYIDQMVTCALIAVCKSSI